MNFNKNILIMAILFVSQSVMPSVAPVSGNLSNYGASYAAKLMPSMTGSASQVQGMDMPRATLNKKAFNASVLENQASSQPWTNQQIRRHPAMAGQGSGMFKGTRSNLMRATNPLLMTRQEAAEVLHVDQNATEKDIKTAYKKAALRAHPDLGGSDQMMKNVNLAKEVLLGLESATSEQESDVNNANSSSADNFSSSWEEKKRAQAAYAESLHPFYDLLNAVKSGDDAFFDSVFNKEKTSLSSEQVIQVLNEIFDYYPNSSAHMVDTILSKARDLNLPDRYLTKAIYAGSRQGGIDNPSRSAIPSVFIKHGYKFNTGHLNKSFSEESSNFQGLKALLSAQLESVASVDSLQEYQKVVGRLNELKKDIDKPIEVYVGREKLPRKYSMQDLDEALDLAHQRVNEEWSKASYAQRMQSAFKGGMSSMWGKK